MIRMQRAAAFAALNVLVLAGLSLGAAPANAAVSCQSSTPLPTNNYPGTTVVATSFEAASISATGFDAPVTRGTGKAGISNGAAHTGKCAARLQVTTDAESVAKFQAQLPSKAGDVYADGWFNVATPGAANNNVPMFRFFNGNTRVLDVFRSNDRGELWLRVTAPDGTYSYTRLASSVDLGTWHHLVVHVVPNGDNTTAEIQWNGKEVFSSKTLKIGFDNLTAVQLGAEHPRQAGDSYIDDVIIKASGKREAGTFNPVDPIRLLDTRGSSPVGAKSAVSFKVAGTNGIPDKVSGVVFNLTVTQPEKNGFIAAAPGGTATAPNASNVNFGPGQTVPNLVSVPVGPDGQVKLFNQSTGKSHLIADVAGYYTDGKASVAGSFQSMEPFRILDTRPQAVGPDATVSFQVEGVNGIPADVSAVVFNLTVAESQANGFATAYPSKTVRPEASNLNFAKGQIVPNLVTVPVGSDGKVTILNRSDGSAQFIADVAGYYLPGTPTATGSFKAVAPDRILDTRKSTAAGVGKDGTISFAIPGGNGAPLAAVFNLTVASPQDFGFVTAFPSGTTRPNASNLNFAKGQIVPNLVAVRVGNDGKVSLFNRSNGNSHLIADLAGYFLR